MGDKRVSVAANAIAWELFAGDGRPTRTTPEGTKAADMTDEECKTAMRIARRVVSHLDEYQDHPEEVG